MRLKLLSWNVNGIRAVLRRDGFAFLEDARPDVLCLQEVRATPEQAGPVLPKYRHQFWNPAPRPGYSGTATFSRVEPVSVRLGMGSREHDGEGRVLTLELDRLFVVNVYTPNSQRELGRLPYRVRWDRAFLRFIRRLERVKPVLFCGDINVAHEEIDLARPKENRGTHGFTDEERAGFSADPRGGLRRHVPRPVPRGRPLHLVERVQPLARTKRGVADRLRGGFGGPRAVRARRVHPPRGRGLGPLPRGGDAAVVTAPGRTLTVLGPPEEEGTSRSPA